MKKIITYLFLIIGISGFFGMCVVAAINNKIELAAALGGCTCLSTLIAILVGDCFESDERIEDLINTSGKISKTFEEVLQYNMELLDDNSDLYTTISVLQEYIDESKYHEINEKIKDTPFLFSDKLSPGETSLCYRNKGVQ